MSRGVALLTRSLQKMIQGIEKHWCEAVLNTIQSINNSNENFYSKKGSGSASVITKEGHIIRKRL